MKDALLLKCKQLQGEKEKRLLLAAKKAELVDAMEQDLKKRRTLRRRICTDITAGHPQWRPRWNTLRKKIVKSQPEKEILLCQAAKWIIQLSDENQTAARTLFTEKKIWR